MQPLRSQTPAGPEESRRGARRGAPRPRLPPSSRAPAHSPSPTVPSFSPQVLKLSLRGDTAAAAALLPLLCLPMDMHCKADPFSAMHREYRRPAPARFQSHVAPAWSGPLRSGLTLEATLAFPRPSFRSFSYLVFLTPLATVLLFAMPYLRFCLPFYLP